jgi:hypothetical protein
MEESICFACGEVMDSQKLVYVWGYDMYEEIQYIDSIYRGRYPGEAGLLPLGEPDSKDADKAIAIATNSLGSA